MNSTSPPAHNTHNYTQQHSKFAYNYFYIQIGHVITILFRIPWMWYKGRKWRILSVSAYFQAVVRDHIMWLMPSCVWTTAFGLWYHIIVYISNKTCNKNRRINLTLNNSLIKIYFESNLPVVPDVYMIIAPSILLLPLFGMGISWDSDGAEPAETMLPDSISGTFRNSLW